MVPATQHALRQGRQTNRQVTVMCQGQKNMHTTVKALCYQSLRLFIDEHVDMDKREGSGLRGMSITSSSSQ